MNFANAVNAFEKTLLAFVLVLLGQTTGMAQIRQPKYVPAVAVEQNQAAQHVHPVLPANHGGLRSTSTQAQLANYQSEIIQVPLSPVAIDPGTFSVAGEGNTVSIFADDVDIRIVLAHLAEEINVNIVIAEDVQAKVTTTLKQVPIWQALDAILKVNGLVWSQSDNIIYVSNMEAKSSVSGRSLQVFELNYTDATEVITVVQGLLSPIGQAFSHEVAVDSSRNTRERIVVEDYPDRLRAISQYLASVDNPPRQVLIEVNVLQVTLDNNQRHGINMWGIARAAGAQIDVRSQGFADGNRSPGFMIGINGTDMDSLLEALRSNSNVRTLASPKVLVVNGQEARIQIGSKFGYFVTTTTQTSTLQSVDFLDIGVVLQVQPTITDDGQVMISVAPKVSGGRISPDTGLPEEDTTEANTTVLLPDGLGMVIGGLIKETSSKQRSWVPWLGERKYLGALFRKWSAEDERVEVVIALTPHIVPFGQEIYDRENMQFLMSSGQPQMWDGIERSFKPQFTSDLHPILENEIGSSFTQPHLMDLPPLNLKN
ncbi:MAG: hypothetical protein KDB03_05310 [Planctomycetales bacterium]|nr:hypothetical protein [Planctomycetales bacterium]